jgi:ArsR family transcriptional regulator
MKIDYDGYASLMKVLADATRLRIISMLSKGELCACKILEEFNITQPTLSHHMKTLKSCGLVECRKDGVWMKYTLNKPKLELIVDFLDLLINEPESESADTSC